MDVKELDVLLKTIADKKSHLFNLDYNDDAYDHLEEELHELEDSLVENYGTYLEDAIHLVHDEYCPDTEVLSPLAYIARKYEKNANDGYEVSIDEGIPVDADDFPGKLTKLVLVPGPPRLLLQVNNEKSEKVWEAKLN